MLGVLLFLGYALLIAQSTPFPERILMTFSPKVWVMFMAVLPKIILMESSVVTSSVSFCSFCMAFLGSIFCAPRGMMLMASELTKLLLTWEKVSLLHRSSFHPSKSPPLSARSSMDLPTRVVRPDHACCDDDAYGSCGSAYNNHEEVVCEEACSHAKELGKGLSVGDDFLEVFAA